MSKQRSWVPKAAAPEAPVPAAEPVGAVGGHEFAPYARRFVALLVDWVICLAVAVAVGEFTGANIRRSPWIPDVLLFFLYVIFVSALAWTPGMRLAGIRCVRFPDSGRLAVTQVAVRAVLLCLFVPALVITDATGRGWHDKAAGSVTILSARS